MTKKQVFRPVNFACLILYIFTALFWLTGACVIIYSIFLENCLSWFEWLCLAFVLLLFTYLVIPFAKTKLCINNGHIDIHQVLWLKKRKSGLSVLYRFVFVKGNVEQRYIEDQFDLDSLETYGFIEDIGLYRRERDPYGCTLHKEVAFLLKNGNDLRWNIKPYTKRTVRRVVELISSETGIVPTGKLADL